MLGAHQNPAAQQLYTVQNLVQINLQRRQGDQTSRFRQDSPFFQPFVRTAVACPSFHPFVLLFDPSCPPSQFKTCVGFRQCQLFSRLSDAEEKDLLQPGPDLGGGWGGLCPPKKYCALRALALGVEVSNYSLSQLSLVYRQQRLTDRKLRIQPNDGKPG